MALEIRRAKTRASQLSRSTHLIEHEDKRKEVLTDPVFDL
jgi:hypothetical protein